MIHRIAAATLLVPDYDEAIAWFRQALGFALIEDTPLGGGKRWVVVAPDAKTGAALVLAVPGDERQRLAIGRQTGGRVGFFVHSDDFAKDHEAMRARGVNFLETPRSEPYGMVAVFADPWGGKWDLLQPTAANAPALASRSPSVAPGQNEL